MGYGIEGFGRLVRTRAGGRFGTGEQKGVTKTSSIGGGNIRTAVPHQDRLPQVEREVSGSAKEHSRIGLTVLVFPFIVAETVLRVKWAAIDGRERCAAGG